MPDQKLSADTVAWALQHVEEHGFGDLVDADAVIEEAARAYLTAVTPLHVRIMQAVPGEGNQLIADLPAWPYPVPQRGDYLFHPPFRPGDAETNIAGCVKTVTWRTHDRPAEPGTGFVQTDRPYVEVYI